MSAEAKLRAVRRLTRDMTLECTNETHTFNGKPLIVVDEDGKRSRTGTGYFAHPDGRRIQKREKGWPKGHRAEPCGKCWGCRMSALGCGVLHIIDGRGVTEIRLTRPNSARTMPRREIT